jgi:hypothetical protein
MERRLDSATEELVDGSDTRADPDWFVSLAHALDGCRRPSRSFSGVVTNAKTSSAGRLITMLSSTDGIPPPRVVVHLRAYVTQR